MLLTPRLFLTLLMLCSAIPVLASPDQDDPTGHDQDDPLVVTLGSAALRMSDIDASLLHIPPQHRSGFFNDPERIGDHLETLVLRRALVREIEASEYREEFDTDQLRAAIRADLLATRQLETMLAEPEPQQLMSEARQYYADNPEQFTIGETVSVSHVLIDTRNRTEEEALALAMEVLERARAGESFEALVEAYSDDPAKHGNKGRYDRFRRGMMVEPFEEAAFSMTEPGELSEPVLSQFGYHIIQFHERQASTLQPFDAVSDKLLADFLQENLARQRQSIAERYEDPGQALAALAEDGPLADEPLLDQAIELRMEEALIQRYREHFFAENISEDLTQAARERYLTRKQDYRQPAAVDVELILISAKDHGQHDAKARVDELMAELEAGADFSTLLVTYSDDPTVEQKQGRYTITEDRSKGVLSEAILAAENVGDVVGPIENPIGYYVARVVERHPGRQLSFDEVQDRITKTLTTELRRRLWDARLHEINQLPFWADQELVASLRTRYILTEPAEAPKADESER